MKYKKLTETVDAFRVELFPGQDVITYISGDNAFQFTKQQKIVFGQTIYSLKVSDDVVVFDGDWLLIYEDGRKEAVRHETFKQMYRPI